MATHVDLLALEKRFWNGDAEFYRNHVDGQCLVAFPNMAGVMTNHDIVGMVKKDSPQWSNLQLLTKGCVEPMQGMAVLSYEASATRTSTGEPYTALVSSGYVKRDGAWKLAFHQQTPLVKKN